MTIMEKMTGTVHSRVNAPGLPLCSATVLLSAIVLSGCSSSSNVSVDGESMETGDTTMQPVESESENSLTDTGDIDSDADTNVDSDADTSTDTDTDTDTDSTETDLPLIAEGNQAIENIASVYIAQTQGATALEVEISGQFHRLTTPQDNAPVLRNRVLQDTCEVGSAASQLNADALNFPVDNMLDSADGQVLQITPISLGDSIEIESDAGTFASLVQSDAEAGELEYQLSSGAPLMVNVPDALSFNAVNAPTPTQWDWVRPESLDTSFRDAVRGIGTNPVLTWSGAEQTDTARSQIMIYAGYINELTGAFQSFECTLQDDGEFTLPEEIQALYANGFSANFVDVVRHTRSLESLAGTSFLTVFMQKL